MFFTVNVAASELAGLWLTHDDEGKPTGYIIIIEENAMLSGVIEKGLETDKEKQYCTVCKGERKGQKLAGMTMMKGVVDKGHGRDQGTERLDPFSGHTYWVKLKLKESDLSVPTSAKNLYALCKEQQWTIDCLFKT